MNRKNKWTCGILSALVAGVALPASAATYVVDQQNPGASDAGPGSVQEPFKTLGHAAEVAQPGDIVDVMEGQYDKLTVKNSGAQGKPIVFRGLPWQKAQIGGIDTGKAAWVCVEGFHVVGDGATVDGDHVEILDNYFDRSHREAVSGTATNVHVAYNRVYEASAGIEASGESWLVECNVVERLICTTVESDYARFFGKGHVFRRNFFHGNRQAEIGKSHVDFFQSWHLDRPNGGEAHDMKFLDNVCYNAHEAIISRNLDKTKNWESDYVVRGNIFAHGLLPDNKGANFLIFENVPNITVEHNLIADVQWFATSDSGTTSGVFRNNIACDTGNFDRGKRPEALRVDHNIVYGTKVNLPAGTYSDKDPMFVDAAKDHWRLKPGSPAIGAASDGSTIGPFASPAVYTVDERHPGASDAAELGHPGRPFKTLTHALAVAKNGETIVVYGGVYRECPVAQADDVTIQAAPGEHVVLSGADVVAGWQRDAHGWSVAMAAAPTTLLCDGKPAKNAVYDAAAKRLRVKDGDPRLSVYEMVVRAHGLDLRGKKVKVKGVTVADTGGEGIVGEAPK